MFSGGQFAYNSSKCAGVDPSKQSSCLERLEWIESAVKDFCDSNAHRPPICQGVDRPSVAQRKVTLPATFADLPDGVKNDLPTQNYLGQYGHSDQAKVEAVYNSIMAGNGVPDAGTPPASGGSATAQPVSIQPTAAPAATTSSRSGIGLVLKLHTEVPGFKMGGTGFEAGSVYTGSGNSYTTFWPGIGGSAELRFGKRLFGGVGLDITGYASSLLRDADGNPYRDGTMLKIAVLGRLGYSIPVHKDVSIDISGVVQLGGVGAASGQVLQERGGYDSYWSVYLSAGAEVEANIKISDGWSVVPFLGLGVMYARKTMQSGPDSENIETSFEPQKMGPAFVRLGVGFKYNF